MAFHSPPKRPCVDNGRGWIGLLLAVFVWTGATLGQQPGEAPPDGVDVQARGPVHEAFGEPTRSEPVRGIVVPQAPPAPIEEQPPDERPEGDNIAWIPGYWGWDEASNRFLWISGFWRAIPPGRTWVPGTWQRLTNGYCWVSGYWGLADQQEVEYLPPPPAPVEVGPAVPAPGPDYIYVPGCWVYRTRYVWRPGHWILHRPGWVWVPDCYRWTPCGYVFVPGYWDVPLLERGMLFAPVTFSPVVLRPGFVYRPAFVVQPDFLVGALFVSPGAPCYYFGDYFEVGLRRRFVPWIEFRFGVGSALVDVNFAYYRRTFADVPGWHVGLGRLYAGRYNGIVARPPRTLIQQNTVINNIVINKTTNNIVNNNIHITNIQNATVLAPASRVRDLNVTAMASLAGPQAKMPAGVTRQVRVDRATRDQLQQERQTLRRYEALAADRQATLTKLASKAPTAPTAAPIKTKINLPPGTPPARVIHTQTPPPPTRPVKPTEKPTVVDTKPKMPVNPPTSEPRPKLPGKPAVSEPQPKLPGKPPIAEPRPKEPRPKEPRPLPVVPPAVDTKPKTPTPMPMPKPLPMPKPTTPAPAPKPMNPAPTPAPKPTTPAPQPNPTPRPTNPPMPTPRPGNPPAPRPAPQPMPPAPRPTSPPSAGQPTKPPSNTEPRPSNPRPSRPSRDNR